MISDSAEEIAPPPPRGGPLAPLREKQIDAQGRSYATGKRKNAIARVWLKPGTGKITVNGRDQDLYFARPTLRLVINQPFQVADREGAYDIVCTVKGGGLSGQAGAVKHGIAQALQQVRARAARSRSRPPASSPATAAWSSARSTAAPRPARASSSASADTGPRLRQQFSATAGMEGRSGNGPPFCFQGWWCRPISASASTRLIQPSLQAA